MSNKVNHHRKNKHKGKHKLHDAEGYRHDPKNFKQKRERKEKQKALEE